MIIIAAVLRSEFNLEKTKIAQVGGAKEEMALLHLRLTELEASLAELEVQTSTRKAGNRSRAPRKKAS